MNFSSKSKWLFVPLLLIISLLVTTLAHVAAREPAGGGPSVLLPVVLNNYCSIDNYVDNFSNG